MSSGREDLAVIVDFQFLLSQTMGRLRWKADTSAGPRTKLTQKGDETRGFICC